MKFDIFGTLNGVDKRGLPNHCIHTSNCLLRVIQVLLKNLLATNHDVAAGQRLKELQRVEEMRVKGGEHDAAYKAARLGVAVSQNPEGPFAYLGSERPHGGQESRDFTVWQDPDPEGAGAGGGHGRGRSGGFCADPVKSVTPVPPDRAPPSAPRHWKTAWS